MTMLIAATLAAFLGLPIAGAMGGCNCCGSVSVCAAGK